MTILAASFTLLAGLCTQDPPGDRPSLATCFPPETWALAEFAGLEACARAADGLGLFELAQFAAQKGGKAPLGELVRRHAGPELDELLGRAGFDRDTVRQLLQGPMALGLSSRMTFFGEGAMPAMTLVVDVPGREQAAQSALGRLTGALANEGVRVSQRTITGVSATVLEHRHENGAIAMAVVGGRCFVSNSEAYLAACLGCGSAGKPSLAGDELFQRARHAAGSALVSAFVSTRLLGCIGDFLPYEFDGVLAALGIEGCDSLMLYAGADGRVSRDGVLIGMRTTGGGAIHAFLGGTLQHRAARYCPEDTAVYLSLSTDAGGLIDAFHEAIAALPRAARDEVVHELDDELHRELAHAGLSPEQLERLARATGPEWSVALPFPRIAMGVPQIAHPLLFCSVDPEARISEHLTTFLEQHGCELNTANFEGHELRYVNVQLGDVRLSPSFVEHDGMLIACSDLRALKAALRRPSGEEHLAASAAFQAKVAAHADASRMLLVRVTENLTTLYEALRPLAENWLASDGQRLGLSPADLPDLEQLRTLLADVLVTATLDETGLAVHNESWIGPGAVLAGFGRIVDDLLAAEPTEEGGRPKRRIY